MSVSIMSVGDNIGGGGEIQNCVRRRDSLFYNVRRGAGRGRGGDIGVGTINNLPSGTLDNTPRL